MPRKRVRPAGIRERTSEGAEQHHKMWSAIDVAADAVLPKLWKIQGLPEPAREALAQDVYWIFAGEKSGAPTEAEIRAKIRAIRKKAAELLDELYGMEPYSAGFLDSCLLDGEPGWGKIGEEVELLEEAADFSELLSLEDADVYPRATTRAVVDVVRKIFDDFDIPFSLAQTSPAVETVHAILNMVRPMALDAARQAVHRAVTAGDKKPSPSVT
jgi:hypothetical protein